MAKDKSFDFSFHHYVKDGNNIDANVTLLEGWNENCCCIRRSRSIPILVFVILLGDMDLQLSAVLPLLSALDMSCVYQCLTVVLYFDWFMNEVHKMCRFLVWSGRVRPNPAIH
jgi:hypothetical protein